MGRLLFACGLALISVTVASVYYPVLDHEFVFDDHLVISENPWIQQPGRLLPVFSQKYYTWSGESSFRPVTTLSYLADRILFGPSPHGYHATNVLLHTACVLLVGLTARRLRLSVSSAWLAALWFGIHPAQVEAVAGIAFREDPLASLFLLLALQLLLTPAYTRRSARIVRFAALFALGLLSALSKETGFILPALVILVEVARRFGRQLRSRSVAADFAAVLLAAVLATVVWHMWRLPAAPVESNHTSGLWGRLTEVPNLLSYYVNLTLWPSDLGVDPVPPDGNCAATLALCLGLAATISVVFYARAGRAIIGLGIALLGLAPVLQIIPIFNSVAERFIYLPMAGLALMVAAALAAAANRGRRWNWLLAGCWSAVCVLYLPLTAKQVSVWQNELTLFTASVHSNPHSARGHYNLARAQQAAGLWADAARHYRAAIALSYEKGFVHYNLGLTLAALNEWEAAEHAFQAAAELLPSDARPWNNLGVIAAQQGRYQDAAFSFEQALAREPESLKTLQNLYLACVHLGDTERANWAAAEAQRLLAPQPAAGH